MFARPLVLICAATATTVLACCGARLFAAEKEAEPELPIKRIVMYTSGVGFFERSGKVNDDATIELRFGSRDINDLLKSLVLEDLDGGQVTTVSYNARNPVNQSLKTFSIDLTTEPTLANLLRQVRGERIRVEMTPPVEGRILGVEQQKQISDKGILVTHDVLNLMTDDGLQAVWLEDVAGLRLLDEKLNAELNEALVLLAQSRTTDKKSVALRCTGKGERTLRVGYVQETPVWKTSYRLVLRDEEKPFLQGWAIVENTGDHDWKDVQLSLVSGRPVSFMMDLYQPLYAARPMVQLELFAGLQPQRHSQDLFAASSPRASGPFGGMGMGGIGGGMGGGFGGMAGYGGFGGGANVETEPTNAASATADHDGEKEDRKRLTTATSTVPSTAKADEVGELFRYSIDAPVTLSRQQSAMLPIVNEVVAGEKLAIFNAETDSSHPLSAFYLENSTKLHLMQGPITVFDAGEYAGDGQIADIEAGAKRLVSYALDLNIEVATESAEPTERLTMVKIVEGMLHRRDVVERKTSYRIKNSDEKAKKILIEQPFEADWKLVSPKEPTEKTRSLYRFAIAVDGGAPKDLSVVEQREDEGRFALDSLPDDRIEFYFKGDVASDTLKQSLAKVREFRSQVAAAAKKTANQLQELGEISKEQDRIRANMTSLDKSSDLYKRYLQTLGQQEDKIETSRSKLPDLRKAEATATEELAKFIAGLSVN